MSNYTIRFIRSARKELEALPNVLVVRIFKKIEALGSDPRPAGCKKLKGSPNLWRVRVGDYRIVYSILDKELVVEIITVRNRKDAYD
mgnify:CR=1 FL=1